MECRKFWEIDNEKTLDHWLELISTDGCEVSASVKWDGCMNIDNRNGDSGRDGRIHYCNIDLEIKRLLEIRALAKKHFGKDWPR